MRSLLLALACLASAAPALADDDVIDVADERCAAYVPAELDDSMRAWGQVLSFAACIQDSSLMRIADDEDPSVAVATLAHRLAPAMALYFASIQHGPPWVQIRAAYEIGLAHIALMTRARVSLGSAPDLRAGPDAAQRHREQHARLEAAISQYGETAYLVFAAIDRASRQEPGLASDPVTRYVVQSSRQMLEVLSEHAPTQLGTRDAPMDGEE